MAVKNIKKDTSLRKAILQAAITGQLISDIGGESLPLARTSLLTTPSPRGSAPKTPAETGKQLLDRIIEERNKKLLAEWEEALKKNPKAKKPTPIIASEIDEDEIPFEIPENWCWCRWGELSDSIQYGYNAPAKETGRIKMVRITDIQNGKVQWDSVPYCDISDDEITSYQLKKNDILFARTGGTVGKSFLVAEEPEDAVYAGYLIRTQYDSEKLNPKYMKMFMESQLYWDQLKNGTIATAQPNCNGQTLSKMILPLPPLSVQNAIVAKLEQVLPLVDAYENAVLQKEELKSTLSDKVKKAILQEAITGKLTEEWRSRNKFGMTDNSHADADNCHAELVSASQESGEQLLDRIIKERTAKALAEWEEKVKTNPKAKKPVPVVASEIKEEEIPFEIPESWCWCRLGEISDVIMGQSPDGSAVKEIEDGIEFHQGKIFFGEEYLQKSNQTTTESTKIVGADTVLLCVRAPVGKVNLLDRDICIGRGLCALRPILSKKFIYYMLQSLESELNDKATGTTFKAISKDIVCEQLLPLPPLEEQEEIVKKVEELLPLFK